MGGSRGMGAKYRPTIKDQKALRRFHENARRAQVQGPVKNLLHLPTPRPPAAPTGQVKA